MKRTPLRGEPVGQPAGGRVLAGPAESICEDMVGARFVKYSDVGTVEGSV